MKICIGFIALALTARAETFTLTNGVPVSGTVVSSIPAQVVIKTTLGTTLTMPLSAFNIGSLQRMPHGDGNVYAQYARLLEQHESLKRSSEKLKQSTEILLRELEEKKLIGK